MCWFDASDNVTRQDWHRYVETLDAPPDSWGQQVSKRLGWSSTRIMMEMFLRFGADVANAAIDKALKEEP